MFVYILCVLILSSVPKHSESVVLFQGTQKDWGPTSHPDISTCLYLMSLILMLYNLQTCRLKIHFYDLFRVINDWRLSTKRRQNDQITIRIKRSGITVSDCEWMISVVSSEVLNCLNNQKLLALVFHPLTDDVETFPLTVSWDSFSTRSPNIWFLRKTN